MIGRMRIEHTTNMEAIDELCVFKLDDLQDLRQGLAEALRPQVTRLNCGPTPQAKR